jgi:STE20-like kinase
LAAAAAKESTTISSQQQPPTQQSEIPTPIIETPTTNLKIIEQGDEDETTMAIKEEEEKQTTEKPTSPLPPPPPQFANETTLAEDQEQQKRSRKSSKESMKSTKEDEEVQQLKQPDQVRVHQEVRRTVSADDKSISSASSTTITINQLQDESNSLAAANGNQVTIVTSHPPVIIDNSQASPSSSVGSRNKRLSKSLSYDSNKLSANTSSNEVSFCAHLIFIVLTFLFLLCCRVQVIIVSNETNKTKHLHESSTDDDYQSYDSLESSPKYNQMNNINNNNNSVVVSSGGSKARPRKLDESEVLIVSPDGIFEEDLVDDCSPPLRNQNNQFDTSHVSVVTVGDDQGGVKVKDSSGHLLIDSNSDLSNVSDGNDNFRSHSKTNGQIIYNSKRSSSSREDDVNIIVQQPNKIKQRISPDSSVDCSSSTGSPTRATSENGSMRSDQNVSCNYYFLELIILIILFFIETYCYA